MSAENRSQNEKTGNNGQNNTQDKAMNYLRSNSSSIDKIRNIALSEMGASEKARVTMCVLNGLAGSRTEFSITHAIIYNQLQKEENTVPQGASKQEKGNASQVVRRRIKEILKLQQKTGIPMLQYTPGDQKGKQGIASYFKMDFMEMVLKIDRLSKENPKLDPNSAINLEKVTRKYVRDLLSKANPKGEEEKKEKVKKQEDPKKAAVKQLESLVPHTQKKLASFMGLAKEAKLQEQEMLVQLKKSLDSLEGIYRYVFKGLEEKKQENDTHSYSTREGGIVADHVRGYQKQQVFEFEAERGGVKTDSPVQELIVENKEDRGAEKLVEGCAVCGVSDSWLISGEMMCRKCFCNWVFAGVEGIFKGSVQVVEVSRQRVESARAMIEGFICVGVIAFFMMLKDKFNKEPVVVRKHVNAQLLKEKIGQLLDLCDSREVSLIIRPIMGDESKNTLLQLDDLDETEALSGKLTSMSFMTIETSANNYQNWMVVQGMTQAEKSTVRSEVLKVSNADKGATGAVRIVGSTNFKPEYEGNYPVVKLVKLEKDRVVTVQQLRQAELGGCDSSVVSEKSEASTDEKEGVVKGEWFSYWRAVAMAPKKADRVTPDYSVADYWFMRNNLEANYSKEEIFDELSIRRADKIRDNRNYLEITFRNVCKSLGLKS